MPSTKKPTTIPASKITPAGPPAVEREVQYPEVEVVLMKVGTEAGPVTVETAKDLLGWEEETEGVKFGPDFLFTDLTGKKIRTLNNTRNREFNERWSMTIAQEHLQKRWRLNGETLVIGDHGEVISGQHRLIGLALAEQLRQRDEDKWSENWPESVTMDTVVIFGIEEIDDVVNTCDTGRARSFSDVLYRCELFNKYPPKDRKPLVRAADYAVRLLWNRTGLKLDAYAPTRTHQEGMDFLYRHRTLVDKCVKHIVTEENDRSISEFLPLGAAAGLCYLMMASNTDPAVYDKSESSLDLSLLDKAQNFWMLLSGKDPEMKALIDGIRGLADPETGVGGSFGERCGMIVKAWNHWSAGEKITPARIKLDYVEDGEGGRLLNECPAVGGIDLGDPEPETEGEPAEEDNDATVAEVAETIEDRTAAEKAKSIAATKDPTDGVDKDSADSLAKLRKAHPDHVLWFESKDGYNLFGRDAEFANKHVGTKFSKALSDGTKMVQFKKNNFQPAMTAFNEAGLVVATVSSDMKVTKHKAIVKPKTAKK